MFSHNNIMSNYMFTASFSWGPHYTTFDGRLFSFNGRGDFVVTQLLSSDEQLLFTVQIRGAVLQFLPQQTFHIACVFGRPELAFQVVI